MAELLKSQAPSTRADVAAANAAADAGCTIRPLHDLDQLAATAEVFAQVWARDDGEQILPLEMIRALTHAGNYAAGAYLDDRLVGAVVGFFGEHDGVRNLHSHIMGLLPAARGRGIGYALKQHQRAWALGRGLADVTWTFDPLVRANAHLNLTKLGGVAATYLPDFYGTMTDEINAGADSDRLLVTWELDSPRARAASQGRAPRLDHRELIEAGAAVVLAEDADGRPSVSPGDADQLLCQVPRDIIEVRATRPEVARQWRFAVRETLGAALRDGHRATGFTRDGWYVLERPRTKEPT